MRVLVDVSAQFQMAVPTPNGIAGVEREIARRLLDEPALNTLPIVFRTGRMYALDGAYAADLLHGDALKVAQLESGPDPLENVAAEEIEDIHPEQNDETPQTVLSSMDSFAQSGSRPLYGLRRRAIRLALRSVSLAARGVVRLAPERARFDVTQSLRHARQALVAIVRPAQPPEHCVVFNSPAEEPLHSPQAVSAPAQQPVHSPHLASPPELEGSTCVRLSTVVHATRSDIVWTCGPSVECVPLRSLAEAKLATGFRVASICCDMSALGPPDRNSPEVLAGVHVARAIDQLDASDLIFCVSEHEQDDLRRFAAESGRPTPYSRVLPFGDETRAAWDASAATVRDGLLSLMVSESDG